MQARSHIVNVHSGIEAKAGSKQNLLLSSPKVLNIMHPLTRFSKIVGQSASYSKLRLMYSHQTLIEIRI